MKNGKAPKEKTGETLNERILEADIAPINQEDERRMEAHDTLAIMLNNMGGDETGTAKLDKAYNDLASLLTDWPEGSSHISQMSQAMSQLAGDQAENMTASEVKEKIESVLEYINDFKKIIEIFSTANDERKPSYQVDLAKHTPSIKDTINSLERNDNQMITAEQAYSTIIEHEWQHLALSRALSIVVSDDYYCDVAIFKGFVEEAKPAIKYLDSDSIDKLYEEIIYMVTHKKDPYIINDEEIEKVRNSFSLGDDKAEQLKKDLKKMLIRYKTTSIKNESTEKSLKRWYKKMVKEYITTSADEKINSEKYEVPTDKTEQAFKLLSPEGLFNIDKGNSVPVIVPMQVTYNGKPTIITAKEEDFALLVSTLYNRARIQGKAKKGYFIITFNDLAAHYYGHLDDPNYKLKVREMKEIEDMIEKGRFTRVIADITQEAARYFSRDNKKKYGYRKGGSVTIDGTLISGDVITAKAPNGFEVKALRIRGESAYFEYCRDTRGLLSYPGYLRKMIVQGKMKKINGVYQAGARTRKPKYYDDFYYALLRDVTLRKEGRLRTDRISIEEEKPGMKLNIYQRAGVPAPSEAEKHGMKKKQLMRNYREAIELGLDNLQAHKYIRGYKSYYKKGTHSIAGYEIEFYKADQSKREEARKAAKKKK